MEVWIIFWDCTYEPILTTIKNDKFCKINTFSFSLIWPLAPSPDELFITAAEVRTNQQWLITISVRVSQHISSVIDRLVIGCRVGVNGKITSDTYTSALSH